jgi:hypothetical protein
MPYAQRAYSDRVEDHWPVVCWRLEDEGVGNPCVDCRPPRLLLVAVAFHFEGVTYLTPRFAPGEQAKDDRHANGEATAESVCGCVADRHKDGNWGDMQRRLTPFAVLQQDIL